MRKKILFILLILSMLFAYIIHVFQLNKDYKHNEENKQAIISQSIEVEGITFCVNRAELYDLSAFVQEYPNVPWYTSKASLILESEQEQSVKVLVYELQISISEEATDAIELVPMIHQTMDGSMNAGNDYYVLGTINDLDDIQNNLQLYKKTTMYVPVFLTEQFLAKAGWAVADPEQIEMEIILAIQPVKQSIVLNRIDSYFAANKETDLFLADVVERTKQLQEAYHKGATIEVEQNQFENGKGSIDTIEYEVLEISEISLDELKQYGDESDNISFFLQNLDSSRRMKFFTCDLNIANQTEMERIVSLTNIYICTVSDDGNVLGVAQPYYSTFSTYSETKSSLTILLESKQTEQLRMVFMSVWGENDNYGERWEMGDYYLMVHRNYGSSAASMNDKTNIFLKYNGEVAN